MLLQVASSVPAFVAAIIFYLMATEQAQTDPAWTDADLSESPHENADKATRVRKMFSAIAPSYDRNNRIHSLGRDQAWRRTAVQMARLSPGDRVLDVACGTGDLAIAFRNALDHAKRRFDKRADTFVDLHDRPVNDVVGLDFTYEMLPYAVIKSDPFPGLDPQPDDEDNGAHGLWYINGDAMALPFDDQSFDVLSIAFGIRNVADPAKAMAEFFRVLRPGGRVIVLEFSLPKNPVLLAGYNFYFKHVMPRTATLIAGDKSGAYKYLPKSVNTFIDREGMTAMMADAGLKRIEHRALTFGIAVCYRGVKPG